MTLEGGKQLRARLKAIGDTRAVLKGLQIGSVEEAKRLAVPFKKTGNLQRSIQPGSLTDSSAIVQARAPYAAYIERGTGLYGPSKKKIVPRNAKTLAWRTGATRLSGRSRTQGGQPAAGWAFAKSVRGRRPTPYLLPGAKKAAKERGADVVVELWNGAA